MNIFEFSLFTLMGIGDFELPGLQEISVPSFPLFLAYDPFS